MSVIKVVLRKKPKADGTRPLALRIYKEGQESYIYLGYYILEQDWDAITQRVRKSYPSSKWLNNIIVDKINEVMKTTVELEATRGFATTTAVKQKIKPKAGDKFFAQAKLYLDTLKEAGKYNRYSADNSKIEHFREFCGRDIRFDEITVSFLEKYKHHCVTKLSHSERTAINQWVLIRSVFSQAIKSEVTDTRYYPFGRGKIVIKFPESKKVGFSIEDIQKLENVQLIYPLQDHARNIWLFSFYVGGMRGSDVLRLKWLNIQEDQIIYTMAKNMKPVRFTLPEKALAILSMYSRQRKNIDDLIFPELKVLPDLEDRFAVEKLISNCICRIDKLLTHKVAPKAGITTNITMHLARHSFGKIAGDTIPITILQKIFRHSDIATTIGYMNNFIHKDEDKALDDVVNFKAASAKKFTRKLKKPSVISA